MYGGLRGEVITCTEDIHVEGGDSGLPVHLVKGGPSGDPSHPHYHTLSRGKARLVEGQY